MGTARLLTHAARHGLADPAVLLERLAVTDLDERVRERVAARIRRDYGRS